jgi:hypothetical protein
MKTLYLGVAVIGAVVPYSQFVPWILDHGLDLSLLIAELFSTRIGAFFGLDVVVSALALFVFVFADGPRQGVKPLWLPVAATLLVGVSCGLPLYLYLRERAQPG